MLVIFQLIIFNCCETFSSVYLKEHGNGNVVHINKFVAIFILHQMHSAFCFLKSKTCTFLWCSFGHFCWANLTIVYCTWIIDICFWQWIGYYLLLHRMMYCGSPQCHCKYDECFVDMIMLELLTISRSSSITVAANWDDGFALLFCDVWYVNITLQQQFMPP